MKELKYVELGEGAAELIHSVPAYHSYLNSAELPERAADTVRRTLYAPGYPASENLLKPLELPDITEEPCGESGV